MGSKQGASCAMALVLLAAASPIGEREWTDATGKLSVEADLLGERRQSRSQESRWNGHRRATGAVELQRSQVHRRQLPACIASQPPSSKKEPGRKPRRLASIKNKNKVAHCALLTSSPPIESPNLTIKSVWTG